MPATLEGVTLTVCCDVAQVQQLRAVLHAVHAGNIHSQQTAIVLPLLQCNQPCLDRLGYITAAGSMHSFIFRLQHWHSCCPSSRMQRTCVQALPWCRWSCMVPTTAPAWLPSVCCWHLERPASSCAHPAAVPALGPSQTDPWTITASPQSSSPDAWIQQLEAMLQKTHKNAGPREQQQCSLQQGACLQAMARWVFLHEVTPLAVRCMQLAKRMGSEEQILEASCSSKASKRFPECSQGGHTGSLSQLPAGTANQMYMHAAATALAACMCIGAHKSLLHILACVAQDVHDVYANHKSISAQPGSTP